MQKLRNKLKRLPKARADLAPQDPLRGQIARLAQRKRKKAQRPWVHLPTKREQSAHGAVDVARQMFPHAHRHGSAPIKRALQVESQTLTDLALDPGLVDVDLSRALFLDTETTGLAGGTGTIPFLVGAAEFVGQGLRTTQYLVRQPGEEKPMLRALHKKIERASCLITYNGKSFDWPLLRNRYVLNRVKLPRGIPHIDLLHCSRRVFKQRLGRVRLVDLESHVLEFDRVDDVDGSEIPWIYWDFQDSRDGSELFGVFEHNVHDLVALAAILGELASRYEKEASTHACEDRLGIARSCHRAGDDAKALRIGRRLVKESEVDEVIGEAAVLVARILQRKERFSEALGVLERGLERDLGNDVAAPLHLMGAKICEHRLKRFDEALVHAEGCRQLEGHSAYRRRKNRLRKRQNTA